ncbi:heterokaryon incompatibility protein-domain-containing protein [Stachybotrys elegans]|uniref:Heterokaryon incompatibility protein-domain-containing protein n=1 Tax=Stachybotrys elegans TaxID=80388 RepID=A0A8K0WKX1_9HYPO|nr:heterokaryon incompatibility protein-domain-containing protein [Stachybotrys elegans]
MLSREHRRTLQFGRSISTWQANFSRKPGSISLRFNVAADHGTPAHQTEDVIGQLFSHSLTWSASNVNAIQSWLTKCRRYHSKCSMSFSNVRNFSSAQVPLPSRCVEILSNGASSYSHILRNTSGQSGNYIILSHRWGQDTELCKTTRATLQCRSRECQTTTCNICRGTIPPITQLFQDAAMLTAALGIKYIWIDSLCIVQDDDDDWEREAIKMSEYYQKACLTICCTALASNGGLFGPISDENISKIARLPYRRQRDGLQEGYFYIQCSETALPDDYKENISKSHLLSRGWVFQEWMLSPRLLTFSGAAGGLFLQCRTHGPRSLHNDEVRSEDVNEISFRSTLNIDLSKTHNIFPSWLQVIERYSGLELTRLTRDRLVALAGIVGEFSSVIKEQDQDPETAYISGHWTGNTHGLMWEQTCLGEKVRVTGIPTWSWASMAVLKRNDKSEPTLDSDGFPTLSGMSVGWSDLHRPPSHTEDICQLEQVVLVHVDLRTFKPDFEARRTMEPPDFFNPMNRFGMLKLKGKLLPVRIHDRFSDADLDVIAAVTNYKSEFGKDMWRPVAVPTEPEFIAGWASLEHPEYQTDEAVTLQAFIVRETTCRELFFATVSHVLLLQPKVINGLRNVYERVGCGRLNGSEVRRMSKHALLQSIYLV